MSSYDLIINKFLKKISQDIEFFMYNGLSEDENMEIVKNRSLNLLDAACDELEPQLDQINLSERNDDTQEFDNDLTRVEIDTISDMMEVVYMREPFLKLKCTQKYLGDDIKTWSPANERKTYIEMLNEIEESMDSKIDKCNFIDRKTGKPRSLYDD